MKKTSSLYTELARYYDLLYSWKPYAREAARISRVIQQYKKTNGNELLDIACGTGKHIKYLKRDFRCTGLDLNQGMLAMARRNNPTVPFRRASMITFKLRKEFDAILCLFSSIGYVKTYAALEKTLRNFLQHLKSGGVVIIEPWLTRSAYIEGTPHMVAYSDANTKVARLSISKLRGNLSILEMHYLIAKKNKSVTHYVELHELAMFEVDKVLALMDKVGLQAEFIKSRFAKSRLHDDKGLFVGVKR